MSLRNRLSDVALFISYVGARKLSNVHSDYSRIHQRSFAIVNGDNTVSDVSLLVAKDLSKKIKKDPNSTSAAGKSVRVPFSSLEDGCGLIELCKHDVWPLPCKGELCGSTVLSRLLASRELMQSIPLGECDHIWPEIEGFIHQEETATTSFSSNIVVGKDENGRSQYFLFLKEPLERGQTLEVHFCQPRSTSESTRATPLDNRWRRNVEGVLSRLSRRGLRSLLQRVTVSVVETIDKRLRLWGGDKSGDIDYCAHKNLFVSRRRAHWIAFKIISQLQGQETKGAKTKSGGADLSSEIIESYNKVAWTPELVAKLKQHPMWTEPTVALIKTEIKDEFEAGILSSEYLNSSSQSRWCRLAKDLFQSLKPRIEAFSGFLEPSCSQESMLKAIREAALTFITRMRGGEGGDKQDLELLVMSFEEFTDGMPCASPLLAHVTRTSVEQAYQDALALCGISPVDITPPRVQRVIATHENVSVSATASQKTGKEPMKKIEEASFRTVEDVARGLAGVHQAWYIRFQLLQVLNALLSVSSVMIDGGSPFKTVAIKAVESALLKEELTKFEKSTVSILAGTPVTFPSEVSATVYQPKPLPLFLGLIWPTLRSSHWRVEAGDGPSDVSFLPPGQRSRRHRGDKRAKLLKQDRTRSRIRLAKASNGLGLGAVSKLTKRLFINAVDGKPVEQKVIWGRVSSQTVSEALECFLRKIQSDMGDKNPGGHKRAAVVVKYIREAFDAIAAKDGGFEASHGKRPSDTAECEHLARFVFIAPSILSQTQLPLQIVEDATLVLTELAGFLSQEHLDLFAPGLCPPKEIYVTENEKSAVLASYLGKPRLVDDSASEVGEISEAILPEDRRTVTDFVQVVMTQVIPCRASQEDIAKKNRRVSLGFIGLMCRHCMGAKGEGRYFFSSIESITTAATVIEKHIQKCTTVPPDVKAKMAECRSRHAEQRKVLGQGAQAAYFLRLWDRLRSSTVRETSRSLTISGLDNEQEDDDDLMQGGLEFESHVPLIEYLKKTKPWSEKPDVMEGVRRYYEGLELGGRIYMTGAMPQNFNSEWLLTRLQATAPLPDNESPIE